MIWRKIQIYNESIKIHGHYVFSGLPHTKLADEIDISGSLLAKSGQLMLDHCTAWQSLWAAGHIEVDGDLDLMGTINAAQYYLLSSLPTQEDSDWPYIGISPTGLPWGQDAVSFSSLIQLSQSFSVTIPKLRVTCSSPSTGDTSFGTRKPGCTRLCLCSTKTLRAS